MPEKTVTIKQVAHHAGVSVGTVSRVINGFDNISSDNLHKVQDAMTSLGYEKASTSRGGQSQSARDGSRKTGNIGIFFSSMTSDWAGHPLFTEYMQGIEQACQEKSYHSVVEFADERSHNSLPRLILENKVDALLLKGDPAQMGWLDRLPPKMPVVGLAMQDPTLQLSQVMPDNRSAGWQMAAYLWEMGHRRIACLMPQAYHVMFLSRRHGVEEFLRQQGAYDKALDICMEQPDVLDTEGLSHPQPSPPDLELLVSQLWQMPIDQRPTAIIAVNDWTAAGLYMAMFKQGLTVGQDISIVGIDDAPSVRGMLNPGLTTYAMPFAQAASVAVRQLIHQLHVSVDDTHTGVYLVKGQIVERQSVADLR